VRLPADGPGYARLNAERLEKQLRAAEGPVVDVLHHVPRRELLAYTGGPWRTLTWRTRGRRCWAVSWSATFTAGVVHGLCGWAACPMSMRSTAAGASGWWRLSGAETR